MKRVINHFAKYNTILRSGVIVFLGLWCVVSLAAFVGMYKLWWDRERVQYLGKDVTEQRKIVFQLAGIPQSYLSALNVAVDQWPEKTHYSIEGQKVKGSYLAYLLIPRVPSSENDSHRLVLTEKATVEGGVPGGKFEKRPKNQYVASQGFVLSVLSISGLALFLRRFVKNYNLSVPEIFAAVCLLVSGVTLLSKVLFLYTAPAFYLVVLTSFVGWISLLFRGGSRIMRMATSGKHSTSAQGTRWRTTVIWISCFLIALAVLWVLLMSVIVVPDDWDAWAIWGAKAKMLALGYGPLEDVFPFGHSDYPLLWPTIWAFSGWCGGGWEEQWSRGWGAVFLLLSCWEIAVIVFRSTKRQDIALMAGALFASIPLVPLIASWSYAEAPFWLMIVSCFGCLSLWRKDGSDTQLIWAAILAVAAAYTKNEGLLFALIMAVWVFFVPGRRIYSLFLFLIVVIGLYAPWYYWVRIVADFGSHATSGLSLSTDAMLRAWGRLPNALEMIVKLYGDVRQWNLVLWGLGCGWVLFFFRPRKMIDALIPVLMLLGYLLIVLFHQAEIYWQVGTSWNRLTVQVLPLLIVVVIPGIVQEVLDR